MKNSDMNPRSLLYSGSDPLAQPNVDKTDHSHYFIRSIELYLEDHTIAEN